MSHEHPEVARLRGVAKRLGFTLHKRPHGNFWLATGPQPGAHTQAEPGSDMQLADVERFLADHANSRDRLAQVR